MSNYICTYFFQDDSDLGAVYGNAFDELSDRNLMYWKTVYTLFFSCILFNRDNDIKYLLFTNVHDFPFRDDLERLGVTIYSDLKLTNRHYKKWATVKFIFDVLEYVISSDIFVDSDNFVFLDTDVLCMRSSELIFKDLDISGELECYELQTVGKDFIFHGLSIGSLESFYYTFLNEVVSIKYILGGEYFAFKLSTLRKYSDRLMLLAKSPMLSTEEQIFSLVNAQFNFNHRKDRIFRVWTTVRTYSVPSASDGYFFLHLPSDKQFGLSNIYNYLALRDPYHCCQSDYYKIFNRFLTFDRPILFYLRILGRTIFRFFKSFIN